MATLQRKFNISKLSKISIITKDIFNNFININKINFEFTIYLFICVIIFQSLSVTVAAAPVSSFDLVNEVIVQSENPRLYDLNLEKFGFELTKYSVNEKNNFESNGISLGLRTNLSAKYFLYTGIRSTSVTSTTSSDSLSLTPFNQAAQPSRKELYFQFGIPIIAGRSFTILSPWMSDWEHLILAKIGLHYNLYDKKGVLPAQRPIKYQFVSEVGLRLQFSLPKSLSVFVDYDYQYPLKKPDQDLKSWTILGGGIAWSIF